MKDQTRSSTITPRFSGPRTGLSVEDIKQSLIDNLFCGMGRVPTVATRNDLYTALALTVRDRVFRHGVHTIESHESQQARRVAYLSAEYLPGPHVALNLLNLGITDQARQAVSELGYDFDALLETRGRTGSWKRWPRPARVLLHGFAGFPPNTCNRLWHPEQIWNVKPVHVEVG